jgi:hypothetical protein
VKFRLVDLAPAEIDATLLDEGTYHCSVSTMYRILHPHALAETLPRGVGTGRPGERTAAVWRAGGGVVRRRGRGA